MAEQYDVIVIGGGVNGTGIARDCAMRGIKTLLIEKEDFGAGATGGSSGMIHGGVRYLSSDVHTTKKSCLDSGYIQKIAPHMIFRIPFIYPIVKGTFAPKVMIELVETYMEAYDRFQPLKRGKPHTRLNYEQVRQVEPEIDESVTGAITMDEWGIDSFRLCAANAVSASEAGANVLNHRMVTEMIIEDGHPRKVTGVKTRSTLDGSTEEFHGRLVFNAGGPWLSKVAGLAGITNAKIRPGKGVHLVLDRRVSNIAVAGTAVDGRQIFVIPHENNSIIGTTDDDYYGDPDDIPVTFDEVEYLLEGMRRILPSIGSARISQIWVALRPTLYGYGCDEDALSREYEIWDHSKRDGVEGLMTMAGGKLASYRLMAADAADQISKKVGHSGKSTTHLAPLPGGDSKPNLAAIAETDRLPLFVLDKLYYRHGSRMLEIIELMREKPHTKAIICGCESVTAAEIIYCIRSEWATTAADIRRRTRLGAGPCQGASCAKAAASILVEELGADGEYYARVVAEFLQDRWKTMRPALRGANLAQAEYARALHLLSNDFGPGRLR